MTSDCHEGSLLVGTWWFGRPDIKSHKCHSAMIFCVFPRATLIWLSLKATLSVDRHAVISPTELSFQVRIEHRLNTTGRRSIESALF